MVQSVSSGRTIGSVYQRERRIKKAPRENAVATAKSPRSFVRLAIATKPYVVFRTRQIWGLPALRVGAVAADSLVLTVSLDEIRKLVVNKGLSALRELSQKPGLL